jgi:HD-like signal output (HDOD) protein
MGAQVDPSLAFTVGLLRDIGKLVINEFLTPGRATNSVCGP